MPLTRSLEGKSAPLPGSPPTSDAADRVLQGCFKQQTNRPAWQLLPTESAEHGLGEMGERWGRDGRPRHQVSVGTRPAPYEAPVGDCVTPA